MKHYLYLFLALCIGAVVMSCRPKNNPEDPKHPHLGETELDEFSPVGTIGTIDGREGIVVDLGDTLGRVVIATMNVGATATTGVDSYGDYYNYEDALALSENETWGKGWYLPSREELERLPRYMELKDSAYQWVFSKKSILYIPLAGEYRFDKKFIDAGTCSHLASCTKVENMTDERYWVLYFDNTHGTMTPELVPSRTSVRLFHSLPTPANAVDLGLPSGTMWAAMNLGAVTIADAGDSVAWGEVETKVDFTWANYKWCEGRDSTFTKYCTNPAYGKVDNKVVLDPEDDIAHVRWGDNWRLPLESEWQELIDNCIMTPATENGVPGIMVNGKNGHSIFMPQGPGNSSLNYTYASGSLDTPYDGEYSAFTFQLYVYTLCSPFRRYPTLIRPILTYKVHSGKQN